MHPGTFVAGILIILLGVAVVGGVVPVPGATTTPVTITNISQPACTLEQGTSPALYACDYSMTAIRNHEMT